jgi:protein KTI12
MALVTFSGYPSSGKTRRAIQLRDHLSRRIADLSSDDLRHKVVILSDDSLNIDRSSYNGTVPVSFFRLPRSITML